MKIFFTGSVRGGRAQQPNFEKIVFELQKYGEVLSAHVANDDISSFGETELESKNILEREQKRILESDIIVAEATTPSLGVGYLLCFASLWKKKILVLYEGENTLKLSAIIKGDENVVVENYVNVKDIPEIFIKYFNV